jgi:hypothetical protein
MTRGAAGLGGFWLPIRPPRQRSLDFRPDLGQFDWAPDRIINTAVSPYKEAGGKHIYAPEEAAYFLICHGYGVVDTEVFREVSYWLRVIIHGNADYLKPLSAISLFQIYQFWDLCSARSTPRGPEVDEYNLIAIVCQTYLLTVDTCESKAWRRRTLSSQWTTLYGPGYRRSGRGHA